MNLPGFRFHSLTGRDQGRYAVNASGNWRIAFGWTKAMPPTSIWKIITEDVLNDQEAPEARLAAHASRRTSLNLQKRFDLRRAQQKLANKIKTIPTLKVV